MNNGHWIRAKQAKQLAERLTDLLDKGTVRLYQRGYEEELKNLPPEKCDLCQGTGKRHDKPVKGKCNGCSGTGKRAAWATHYAFSESNVREFAKFCNDSGGFRIF
jgi:DnaJ-class molecular chaperone